MSAALPAALAGAEAAVWIGAIAVAALVVPLGLRLLRSRAPGTRVRRMGRRGASVARIARRSGLAQDAVRDLLAEGKSCRAAADPAGPSFADAMRRSAAATTT